MVKNKALIVGIDDYGSGNSLYGCVNDAKSLNELLKKNEDGSPNFDTKLAINVRTKPELTSMIEQLFCEGDPETALLYFSGHGTRNDGGSLVTPDYRDYDEGVSMRTVMSFVHRSKSKNKIIVLDCCYSGKMGELSQIMSSDTSLSKGTIILTGCRNNEGSIECLDDSGKVHGLFSQLLIEGLKGGAADILGRITPAALYSFIDQSLGQWNQRPIFKANICEFLPLRKVKAKVPEDLLRKLPTYFEGSEDNYQLDPSYEFTNNPNYEIKPVKPYAVADKVSILKDLQKLESVGLLKPVDEEHMYFAAMNSKSCKLTLLGKYYWNLSKKGKL